MSYSIIDFTRVLTGDEHPPSWLHLWLWMVVVLQSWYMAIDEERDCTFTGVTLFFSASHSRTDVERNLSASVMIPKNRKISKWVEVCSPCSSVLCHVMSCPVTADLPHCWLVWCKGPRRDEVVMRRGWLSTQRGSISSLICSPGNDDANDEMDKDWRWWRQRRVEQNKLGWVASTTLPSLSTSGVLILETN